MDNELIGVICGFPREDYLLISEIAADSRFLGRGFGKRLVERFEGIALLNDYHKINVGSRDSAIDFYASLGYKPFLLVQFKEDAYTPNDFKNFKTIKSNKNSIEIKVEKAEIKTIKNLRRKFPKAEFQYIFTKKI